jgi:hypothetical protein
VGYDVVGYDVVGDDVVGYDLVGYDERDCHAAKLQLLQRARPARWLKVGRVNKMCCEPLCKLYASARQTVGRVTMHRRIRAIDKFLQAFCDSVAAQDVPAAAVAVSLAGAFASRLSQSLTNCLSKPLNASR